MADGKITVEINADLKRLKRDLSSAYREINKSEKALAKLQTRYDEQQYAKEKEFYKGETTEKLTQAKKYYKETEKAHKTSLENIAKLEKKYPNIKKFDKLMQNSKISDNKGLSKIFSNKYQVPLEEYARYKNFRYTERQKEAEKFSAKAAYDVRKKNYRAEEASLGIPNAEQLTTKSQIIEEQAGYEEITNRVLQLKKAIAEAEIEKKKLLRKESIKKFLHMLSPIHFKGMVKGITAFGKRLKYAALQGLLLRPLRQAFFGIYEAMENATRQNDAFKTSVANLKGALWTGLTPAFNALMPVLSTFIDHVANAVTYISTFINTLFGLKSASKASASALAQSAKKGGGKDKNFAKWDTVQQLQKKQGGANDPIPPTFEQDFSKAEEALERFRQLVEQGDWYGAGAEIGRLISQGISSFDASSLAELISTKIISALQMISGFISGIDFSMLGQKLREFILGIDWLGLAQEAVRLLGEALIAALEFLEGLLGVGPLQGLFQGLADAVRWVLDAIMELFDYLRGETTFEEFFDTLSAGQLIFLGLIATLGTAMIAVKAFTAIQKGLTLAQKGAQVATGLFSKAIKFITSPVGLGVIAITALIAVVVLLAKNWDKIKAKTIEVWTAIKEKVSSVVSALVDKFVAFKDRVVEIFTSIKDGIKDIWEGIKQTAKDALNWLIGKFESFINWIIKGINKIGFDVPEFLQDKLGFEKFGFNLQSVSLPRLAQGTVVNPGHQFAAILGDNRREQEIVSPLSTMKEALLEAMQEGGMNRGGTIVMKVDGATLARVTTPYFKQENMRLGVAATEGGLR